MATGKEKTIANLVAGCRQGNKDDWAELIDRLSPFIFSICFRYRLSREESFDIFGKVSLLLLEKLKELRDDSRIFGYVSTITQREAAALKSRNRLFVEGRHDAAAVSKEGVTLSMQPSLELKHDLSVMARAYGELSTRCRELLRMLFLDSDDITYDEISAAMDIPVPSIGPTRRRCLEKLRKLMRKHGYEE